MDRYSITALFTWVPVFVGAVGFNIGSFAVLGDAVHGAVDALRITIAADCAVKHER